MPQHQKTYVTPAHAVWREEWEQCVGDEYEEAQQMPDAQESDAKAPSDNPNMASYQFQIRARPPNGRWRSSLLLGLAVGKEHIVSGMSQVQCMNRIVMLMQEAVPDELKGCPMHVCAFCPKACLPACQPNFPIVTQDCICTWCPHYAACNVRVGNRPLLMYVDYVP